MADLGDVSSTLIVSDVYTSYHVPIPVWPDVSTAIPSESGGSTAGGIPGSVTFS